MPFIVTNRRLKSFDPLKPSRQTRTYTIYSKSDISEFEVQNQRISLLIDGYILPRTFCADYYGSLIPQTLVSELYKRHGLDFIKYIKGFFLLVMGFEDGFRIFTDHLGIKKLFYCVETDSFLFSNSLEFITANVQTDIDPVNVALHSLMNHYIDGRTFLKGVYFAPPASQIEHTKKFQIKPYWRCDELLNIQRGQVDFRDFADQLSGILKGYIEYLKPSNIAMTLTGGLDSRTILSVLLSLEVEPVVFSYGNPTSIDSVFAKMIAEKGCFSYWNFYENDISPKWFSTLAEKIVAQGNSLIHLHRAHRFDAVQKLSAAVPEVDMMIGGYMGGEGIIGLHYDDLIVSEFVRRCWSEKKKSLPLIKDVLEKNFLRLDTLDLNLIRDLLKNQSFMGNDLNKNHFYFSYLINAGIHHAQDVNLQAAFVNYPVPLFMDIDYLYLLFSTNHSMLNKDNRSRNFFKRLRFHELNCNLVSILAPELANLPFAKQGYYSANEYLGSRLLLYFKRAYRYLMKNHYDANFSIDGWMATYVRDNFMRIKKDQKIRSVFELEKAIAVFERSTHEPFEAYWHRYSDIILLDIESKYYLGNR